MILYKPRNLYFQNRKEAKQVLGTNRLRQAERHNEIVHINNNAIADYGNTILTTSD